MKKKYAVKIFNIIFIAVFLFSAFNIAKIYYDYNKADNTYNYLQQEYVKENTGYTQIQENEGNEPEQTEETEPPEGTKLPVKIDFDSLSERNGDVIGWLYCPETAMNYPVAQGKDNNQYLRHDLDGNYIISGTIFADYRNAAPGEDTNYIIYGHNMRNATMFSILTKYKDQSYYEQHPVMYYLTPDKNYKIELFAGLVVRRDDKIYLPDMPKDEFNTLLEEYIEKSTFKTDIELNENDIIVTLSTCSYEFDHARYILIGRLITLN